jgi:hypothetical protein
MWPLIGLLVVLALFALILASVGGLDGLLNKLSPKTHEKLPYTSRESLLTKNEAAFYHGLRRVVSDQFVVTMKVRLADVLKCDRDAWKAGHGNRIISKHIDFVLVDPDSTKIIAAIELDDSTHRRRDRRARDEFLNESLVAAGIPFIRFPAKNRYDVRTIQEALGSLLHDPPSSPGHSNMPRRQSTNSTHAIPSAVTSRD